MKKGRIAQKKNTATLIQRTFKGMYRDLLNIPWNLVVITGIGIWVMASPEVLGYDGTIADNNQLLGAIIVSFAIISMSAVARSLRFIHLLLGLWLATAPLFFAAPGAAVWNGIIAGVMLILLSFPKGNIEGSRGDFDQYVI